MRYPGRRATEKGVTLLELLIVIMIIGLLTTAAVKAYDTSLQAGRFQSTARTLDAVAYAIAGNPDLITAGRRVDFGFVGDVGMIPEKLQDLTIAPAGLDSGLWKGPYIINRVAENPRGYMTDAWGDSLVYDPLESLTVASRRGASLLQSDSWIVRRIARNRAALLNNTVSGMVWDARGNPPGAACSLLLARLRFPEAGRLQKLDARPDTNGYFDFGGAQRFPIGNHRLDVGMADSLNSPDTLWVAKTVSVTPGSGRRNFVEIRMPVPFY